MILTKSTISQLKDTWGSDVVNELSKPYITNITSFIASERKRGVVVYPSDEQVFNSLLLTPLDKVRLVMFGQDPYSTKGYAHGLAFSTLSPTTPRSLQNIYNEISFYNKETTFSTNDLTSWAKQGVLLLNTILTVEEGKPLSHAHIGWQHFTKFIINLLNKKDSLVHLLMGAEAISLDSIINPYHHILHTSHPSPLSYRKGCKGYPPFNGSRVFDSINSILTRRGETPIIWQT